ncbi:MAG: LVIVD repeat-containing protein, partial [Nitrospinota bacterium]
MKGAERKNVKVIGHTDMDGRGDAICAIRRGDYLYVGHVFSRGISILDVSNPRRPRVAKWLPNPSPNTWNTNIGVSGDLLLAADERDLFTGNPLQWSAAGMAIYDISKPAEPRKIAYWKTSGQGVHRIWFVDGRMAHVPAHLEGYTGFIYTILDLA